MPVGMIWVSEAEYLEDTLPRNVLLEPAGSSSDISDVATSEATQGRNPWRRVHRFPELYRPLFCRKGER